jgi:hypothetical protein
MPIRQVAQNYMRTFRFRPTHTGAALFADRQTRSIISRWRLADQFDDVFKDIADQTCWHGGALIGVGAIVIIRPLVITAAFFRLTPKSWKLTSLLAPRIQYP